MRHRSLLSATLLWLAVLGLPAVSAEAVKILLITGGCCHDYQYQASAMFLGKRVWQVACVRDDLWSQQRDIC